MAELDRGAARDDEARCRRERKCREIARPRRTERFPLEVRQFQMARRRREEAARVHFD